MARLGRSRPIQTLVRRQTVRVVAPKISTLIDTFDTQIDPAVWNITTGTTWDPSGRVRIESIPAYGTCSTKGIYDFTDSSIFLKVWYAPDQDSRETSFALRYSDGSENLIRVIFGRGDVPNIGLRVRVNNVDDDSWEWYRPTEHMYLRLRSSGTTVYLEGSRYGTAWTPILSKTTTLNLSSMRFDMIAGQWGGDEPDTSFAYFDNINVSGEANPKTATFTETFDTKVDLKIWEQSPSAPFPVWDAGRAKITTLASANGYAYLVARWPFDLRESSVFCKMTPPDVVAESRESEFEVRDTNNSNNFMFLIAEDGNSPSGWAYFFRNRENGTQYQTLIGNYDPVQHAWVRLQMAGTTIYGDTSPDGLTWTNRYSRVTASDLSSVRIQLNCGDWAPETEAGSAWFDSINAAPAGQALTYGTTDGVGLIDATALTVGHSHADAVGLTDTRALGIGTNLVDTVSLTDTRALASGLNRTDSVGLVDAVGIPPVGYHNVALSAWATASSENTAGADQRARKVIDGLYVDIGNPNMQWAVASTAGGVWIQLDWTHPVVIDKITLFDRANTSDNILSGTLTFSDSSTPISTGALPSSGAAADYAFAAKTVTWVRLTADTWAGSAPGLLEFQTWGVWQSLGYTNNIALTGTATASSEQAGNGQTADKAIDGVIDGYPGDYTKEWAASAGGAGAWLQINWASPVTIDRVTLHDRPNPNDNILDCQLTFSDSSTVQAGMLPNTGEGRDIRFTARTVTWVRMTTIEAGGVGLAEFRVWGVPATGYSATDSVGLTDTYSTNLVLGTVQGRPKVWTGSEWAIKPAKVWTGSAWVEKPMKRWTGSEWRLLGAAPAVTTYSLFSGNPSPTPDQAVDGQAYVMGTEFWVNKAGCYVTKVRYLHPTVGNLTLRTMALYSTTDGNSGTKVGGDWTMPTPVAGQWCEYTLPTPILLTANLHYRIACVHWAGAGFARDYFYFHAGSGQPGDPTTTIGGYLVRPSTANAYNTVQGSYAASDTMVFPSQAYQYASYFSDVVVTDTAP